MKQTVRKAAVLGSGVMGSAIAAHLANAGVPTLVLDVVPSEPDEAESRAGLTLDDRAVRDRLASRAMAALRRSRPAAFFSAARHPLIQVGNLTDDLSLLADADWVVEVVREQMEIKTELLPRVAAHLAPEAILSSNTSGLSLNTMAESLPADVRRRFFGTHFFNPPRYMRLLELIPNRESDPAVGQAFAAFATEGLGKGVVPARDTPNFIANRIGLHALMVAIREADRLGLTFEEVDVLTGPAMGRPRTGTFRLADLVGLDTLLYVARNVHPLIPDDESRDVFVPPAYLEAMVEGGMLGQKSGAGFYRRERRPKKQILTFDPETAEYREPRPAAYAELRPLAAIDDPRDRVRALMEADGPAAAAAWALLAPTLSYAAMRLPEIADDAATVDRALRWGFNWELGPFEIWDALGFARTRERLAADGYALPEWVAAVAGDDASTIYLASGETATTPTGLETARAPMAIDPRALSVELLKRGGGTVAANGSATLFELGPEALGVEFHSKMNAIDGDTIALLNEALDRAESEGRPLVVANDGANFCAGANLSLLASHAANGEWEAIETMVRDFQRMTNRLESSRVPVVMAPHGMALGGGAELVLAGNAVQAAAEAYIGLVEVGAGLVPAGGGCLRLYRRWVRSVGDPFEALRSTFETIGTARVSGSAEEARQLGFLGAQDGWSMSRAHLTADARDRATTLARVGLSQDPPERIPVLGRGGRAAIESQLVNMLAGGFISEHDRRIGQELAGILTGGDMTGPVEVAASHLLDLECEAFLRLCGEARTQERIAALLKTGKPLRN